jgi:hypothetical protein
VTTERSSWVAGHGRPATHDVVVIGGAAGLSERGLDGLLACARKGGCPAGASWRFGAAAL